MLLKADNISKHFGGLKALQEVSFEIQPGQIFGLIGPNGAGKTTLFNCLTGLYCPDSGSFRFEDKYITGLSEVRVAKNGISRTFQNIRLFREMTALENVMVGRHPRTASGLWEALARGYRTRTEERQTIQKALTLLDFVGLSGGAGRLAKNFPYGHQRRLEIARALALEPKLLCLDEPAAGMNPSEVGDLMSLIGKIRDSGVTVLLIEHHMKVVMGICDRVLVLDGGSRISEGPPEQVSCDSRVIEAYLGSRGAQG
jgi:branched-chain amino acid transport system ATP-binding protein